MSSVLRARSPLFSYDSETGSRRPRWFVLLAGLLVLLLSAVGVVGGVAASASAHTPLITADCYQVKVDLKSYDKRLQEIWSKTDITDSIRVGAGEINGKPMVIACMDFEFIGGSLGSVMGERIARAVDHCLEHKKPLMIICKSGGARMMESAFSLMQLAKVSGKLSQMTDAGIPYISFLTDPSFGGISASFGMLGDLNIAEPGALIGFAGPRVIKETIKRDLPEGFQRSEFLLEHVFLDFIIDRKALKERLSTLLILFNN